MGMIVYNVQKGRLETIEAAITQENTTWFEDCVRDDDIYMITDFEGGLLIREFGYTYPLRIYEVSRADIGYDQRKAKELYCMYGQDPMGCFLTETSRQLWWPKRAPVRNPNPCHKGNLLICDTQPPRGTGPG